MCNGRDYRYLSQNATFTLLRCLSRNRAFPFFHTPDPFAFLLLPLDSAEGCRAQDADFEG